MTLDGAFQISVGFGAGNIGDEFMARAFWDSLPGTVRLEVALFPEHVRQHEPYPPQHRYVPVDWSGNENAHVRRSPGLLVGDTPVTEAEGLHWPLQFLDRRLTHFHERGLPVYALGVGVDRLESREALDVFKRAMAPVRSWTVRSEPSRQALLSMGVAPERVIVGADWAWLYRRRRDLREWAAALLRSLGIDPAAPLLAVNVVNMLWQGADAARRALAASLDRLKARHGFQICFFCNECRDGEYFDAAAARQIRRLMTRPAAIVPNEYYSPDEALALLAHATVALGQRYHFALQAVLAGSAPVCLLRGAKMRELVAELALPAPGAVDSLEVGELTRAVIDTAARRDEIVKRLATASESLRARARRNLDGLPRDLETGGTAGGASAHSVS